MPVIEQDPTKNIHPQEEDLNSSINDYMNKKRRRSSGYSEFAEANSGMFERLKFMMIGRRLSTDVGDPRYELQAHDLFSKTKRRSSAFSTASDISVAQEQPSFFNSLKSFVTGRRSSVLPKRNSVSESMAVIEQKAPLEEFLPYELNGKLPECLVAKAEKELGETPERRQQAVKELREMILAEGKDFKTDEDILLMFLRGKKFDVRRAFIAMENFYNYKCTHYDQHPFKTEDLKVELESGMFGLIRYRDQYGRAIGISKAAFVVPGRTDANEGLSMAVAGMAKALEEPANQVAGFASILDCSNQSLKCLKYAGLNNVRMVKLVYLECMPARYQALHVLNPNIFFKIGFRISELFVSKKLRDRVRVHGSLKSLHKYVPKAILPPEYGGTLEDWKYELSTDYFKDVKLLS